jgi:hypothetical protein
MVSDMDVGDDALLLLSRGAVVLEVVSGSAALLF